MLLYHDLHSGRAHLIASGSRKFARISYLDPVWSLKIPDNPRMKRSFEKRRGAPAARGFNGGLAGRRTRRASLQICESVLPMLLDQVPMFPVVQRAPHSSA